jgi:tyrosyl-tRNA synthetase
MYGKIMSVSDEMMWRYYELLTDVQVAEIAKMKSGTHPMQAKKALAGKIVTDFHSVEAAAKAAEDWAKQFQKDQVPDTVNEITVRYEDIQWDAQNTEDTAHSPDGIGFKPGFRSIGLDGTLLGIRLDRLLVMCGLADSGTDATRKLKAGSVKIQDQLTRDKEYIEQSPRILLTFQGSTTRLVIRVGKKIRAAVIER